MPVFRRSNGPFWVLLALSLFAGAAPVAHAQDAASAASGTGTQAEDSSSDENSDDADASNKPVLPPAPPFATISNADDLVQAPVRKRSRSDTPNPYDAIGIDAGGLRLFPVLEIGALATTNVARTAPGVGGDEGLRLKPSLRIESEWVRHQLTLTADGDFTRYLDNKELSGSNANARASLRLDLLRGLKADLEANYGLTSTGSSSNEVPASAKSNRSDQTFGASAAITRSMGIIEARLKLGATRNVYGNVDLTGGGTENNEDRNYTEGLVSLRGTVNTGAVVQPYAEVAYEPRIHDKSKDRNGEARNSQGLRATLGLSLNDDPIWTGDIGATIAMRSYADDDLKSAVTPGAIASITYRPTDITRIGLSASTSITETATAGSSGRNNWTAGITVEQDLRDDLLLSGGVNVSIDKYKGGRDVTTTGNLGVTWNLTREFALAETYEGTWFNGSAANSDYTDHRLMTSIILKR